MGDPLSATAAVLGLPGIFMSCVQCFELIQSGRNFERDLLVLTTKFSNQQLRFTKWGEACGFGSPSGYNRGLDEPELKPHIERTFHSIKLLLDSGVSVSKTYEEHTLKYEAFVAPQTVPTRWSWTVVKSRLRRSQNTRDTKDATRWALSDKKKLDEIVRHLSDLIGDLETITKGLGVLERQRYLVQYEIQSISDTETLELMEESRLGSSDMISETASVRLRDLSSGTFRSSHQPGSILDVLSVPDTNHTTETYATAPETLIPDQEAPSEMVAHNNRIMNTLLSTMGTTPKAPSDLNLEKLSLGHMIDRLSLDAFDQALKNHSHLFYGTDPSLSKFARKRAFAEIRNFQNDIKAIESRWFNIHVIGDNLRYILGSTEGPVNSPYEGGIFHLVLRLDDEYPWKPPRCLMLTKIYHPNISPRGEVCIDILKHEWRLLLTFSTILISITSILDDPGLEDPLVPEIAEIYVRDRTLYEENARAYTKKYACEVSPSPETIERFIGICEELAHDGNLGT
jgi:ubiquitin-conjugating enzyme E2 D/E